MPPAAALKSLCLSTVLVVSCAAQGGSLSPLRLSPVRLSPKTNPEVASVTTRPAIIQRGKQPVKIVESHAVARGELLNASFRRASDEEVQEMEQTLEQYVIAFESLDLSHLRSTWPNLDRQYESGYQHVFASLKAASVKPRLDLRCAAPQFAGDTAKLLCTEIATYIEGNGKANNTKPAHISIQLQWQAGRWELEDMQRSR